MIDVTAKVISSSVDASARIYKNAIIRNCTIGENCIVGDFGRVEESTLKPFAQLYPMGTMYYSSLGAYSYAQKNCSIWHAKIGKFCSLSWNVSIGGGEHDFRKVTTHSMLYANHFGFVNEPLYERFSEKCEIGNDVWIAAGASVLRGVTIGDGAVIGAGAVVTRDVEPYSIVAGVPARRIQQRCSDELIADLMDIRWWDWPAEVIRENIQLFNQELDRETVDVLRQIGEEIAR